MKRAKLANGDMRLSSVIRASGRAGKSRKDAARSDAQTGLRKQAESANIKPAPPLPKKPSPRPQAERLICRYCGGDDLAPSFIQRRDRRGRKCFSGRYGSAAPAKQSRTRK